MEPYAENSLLSKTPTDVAFDIRTVNPALFKKLVSKDPTLDSVVKDAAKFLFFPKKSSLDTEHHFYRLPNHYRSFCFSLSQTEEIYDAASLVFKGTEPLSEDFDQLLDWTLLAPFRKSSRVMADHFPLAEGKIPVCYSMKEALREAAISAAIQQKHLHYYGEPARLPTPLLVHRFSDEQNQHSRVMLKKKLAAAAFDKIEPVLAEGLGVLIYHYPSSPLRSNALSAGGGKKLMQYLTSRISVESVIDGWIQLFARLLLLGYLPYTPRNEGLGACMDFGNATLDGGFCDLDSVEAVDAGMDDEFVFESVIQSLMILQSTITRLACPNIALEQPDLYPNIEKFVFARHLNQKLEKALAAEVRPGLALETRIKKLFSFEEWNEAVGLTKRKSRPRSYPAFLKQKSKD